MYALVFGFFDAGHGIVSPRQANFEQGTAASAQNCRHPHKQRSARWHLIPYPHCLKLAAKS